MSEADRANRLVHKRQPGRALKVHTMRSGRRGTVWPRMQGGIALCERAGWGCATIPRN